MMKKIWMIGVVMSALSIAHVANASEYAGVHVRIETAEETMYESTVYVTDAGCRVYSGDVEHVLTGFLALCALEAAAQDGDFTYDATYYEGMGFLLNAIGDIENAGDFSEYWGSYLNFASMSSGLDTTVVAEGDTIVLSYGSYDAITPLRLTMDAVHVIAGSAVSATVDYYSTDWDTMESVYVPLQGAVVIVDDVEYTTDAEGVVTFTLDEPGTYVVRTRADGYTRAMTQVLSVYAAYNEILTSVGEGATTEDRVRDGLKYLANATQNGVVSGSIANTEWAVQAIAAARSAYGVEVFDEVVYQSLIDTVLSYQPRASDGTSELARHILALEAIGYDARNTEGINYVARMKKTVSNRQFGEESLCNDDVFAGLALVAANESFSSKALRRAMKATFVCQNTDGGFGYSVSAESETDTTAAWLMLAGHFKGRHAEHNIPMKGYRAAAFQFMREAQHPDGGWGYNSTAASNSSSTAWAVMGYASHAISAERRMNNNYSGIDFVNTLQGKKGGVQYNASKDYSVVALNTAYAIMSWLGITIGE